MLTTYMERQVNQTITIEKGRPLPAPKGGKGLLPTYPFAKMKKGESFHIKPNGLSRTQLQHRIGTAASMYCSRSGKNWKFSTRQTPDGVGCWRVS